MLKGDVLFTGGGDLDIPVADLFYAGNGGGGVLGGGMTMDSAAASSSVESGASSSSLKKQLAEMSGGMPRWGGGGEGLTQPSMARQCYAFMDEYRLTIQLVLLGVSVWCLWLSMDVCIPCVFVVMLVSLFFCFEYRLMNIVLWASVIVLWVKGWSMGDKNNGLSVSWK
jgi:hypothetical protein